MFAHVQGLGRARSVPMRLQGAPLMFTSLPLPSQAQAELGSRGCSAGQLLLERVPSLESAQSSGRTSSECSETPATYSAISTRKLQQVCIRSFGLKADTFLVRVPCCLTEAPAA